MSTINTINWTTATGTALEVTISTDFCLNLQGIRKTSGKREVVIAAKINGADHACYSGIQPVTGHSTCVAKLGQIGLTPETLAPITAAINAAKAEIADHNAAIEAHAAKLDSLGNGDINKSFGWDA
jgi:hypothetical protein